MPDTAPPPAGLAPREAVPSRTLTLSDKAAFLAWAEDMHELDAGALKVLRVVVMRLLGLTDGKPHNGWTTNGVLATACRLHKRSVRRALDRLQARGLLVRHGFAGRGGRIVLHVPGVVGAAGKLKPRPLGDRTAEGEAANRRRERPVDNATPPAKRGRQRPVSPGEKGASVALKRGRGRPLNPVEDPQDRISNLLEGARGTAAEPKPPAEQGQEGPPAGGLRPDLQQGTLARARLLARLDGIAAKVGRKAGAELLHQAGEERVQRWLRLQRERRDAQLVKEAVGVLASWLGVDRKQLGEAVAAGTAPGQTPAKCGRLPLAACVPLRGGQDAPEGRSLGPRSAPSLGAPARDDPQGPRAPERRHAVVSAAVLTAVKGPVALEAKKGIAAGARPSSRLRRLLRSAPALRVTGSAPSALEPANKPRQALPRTPQGHGARSPHRKGTSRAA